MDMVCVKCRAPVTPDNGLFYCLGSPYHAVLHRWCAPYFHYGGDWPHEQPYEYYLSKR